VHPSKYNVVSNVLVIHSIPISGFKRELMGICTVLSSVK